MPRSFSLLIAAATITLISACTKPSSRTGTGSNTAQAVVSPAPHIEVVDASQDQCPAGGKVYLLFSGDQLAHTQIVCNGLNGNNGHGVVFSVVEAPSSLCANGGSVLLMAVDVEDDGVYRASNPGQQSMTICHGQNGLNGEDGEDGQNGVTPAYATVEAIIPCPDGSPYREVLLRLENGLVLASMSSNVNGDHTRLSFLPDGSYITTDGSNCTFSLATSETIRSMSWDGSVQKAWVMP